MKRLGIILTMILVALNSQAQDSQFMFMGIPLEGPVSTFNQEMLKKDFTRSNPNQNDGTCIYKGSYEGEQTIVFVLYDTQTDFVYRAVTRITRASKEQVLEKYHALCSQIEAQYENCVGVGVLAEKKEKFDSLMHGRAKNPYEWKSITLQNGYETTTLMIPDQAGNIMGDITIFVNESPSRDSQSADYDLFIQYTIWKSQENS